MSRLCRRPIVGSVKGGVIGCRAGNPPGRAPPLRRVGRWLESSAAGLAPPGQGSREERSPGGWVETWPALRRAGGISVRV